MASAEVAAAPEIAEKKSGKSGRARKASEPKADKTKSTEPKKLTAYQLFCKRVGAEIKAKNASLKQTEIMKQVAELWRDSDENPNKGKPVKKRAKKTDKTDDTVDDKKDVAKAEDDEEKDEEKGEEEKQDEKQEE